ncbi:DUF1566 domain-containing protein [Thalassomonas haliotis]|uniref:DUF1566 domain-containing protein n=1 Tax=Thalassomonas haliotis TaxID=485448 RepID=A0ABY7VGY5_9GAMM|nr:DUF1566 domain-containing protein [Thalassomonas haliotis]
MIFRFCILLVIVTAVFGYNSLSPGERPSAQAAQDSVRWQKLTAQGQALAPWAGPWSCVLDKKSGLIWEVKTDNESIHDGYWSYSWFDGRAGQANRGDCYFESERCDTLDLIRRANRERQCGVANWRLPTAAELQSLLYLQGKPGDALIDKGFFPQTKHGDYWSGESQQALTSSFRHLGYGALAVNFGTGETTALPYRNAAFVRLVGQLQ